MRGASATGLVWVECAALANPWGDPIELGALTAELTADAVLAAGNVKGSSAHTELPSGLVALLMLQLKLQSRNTTPNAQLRVVNPHAVSTLRVGTCSLHVQAAAMPAASHAHATGTSSSFGFNGTLVNLVLRGEHARERLEVSDALPPAFRGVG